MGWRQKERIDKCACEQVKPNAFLRALAILKPPIESLPTSSLAALNNKDRKAVKAHQLEVERKRVAAIMQARHRIFK